MVDPKPVPLPPRPTLTATQKDLCFKSAPVFEKHGLQVTSHMYQHMLDANPALKNIFSSSKQATGKQQKALAGALHAYALNIHDPTALLPVVERICHKHASLHITPEQYAIVGHYLVAAIDAVFTSEGVEFSTDLRGAWIDAYWWLSYLFIDIEAGIYEGMKWKGFKEFEVVQRVVETPEITSFYFKPTDGSAVPTFEAGQYVSVQLSPPGDGPLQSRQYSLSDAPSSEHLRISVKREVPPHTPRGLISNLLHDSYPKGSTVELSFPTGEFFVSPDITSPLVLISGGVGATPMMSILNNIAKKCDRRQVSWIQSVREREDLVFGERVKELEGKFGGSLKVAMYFTSPTVSVSKGEAGVFKGRLDVASEELSHYERSGLFIDDATAHYYVCGPGPFMKAVEDGLRKRQVDGGRIHTETFVE